MQHPKISLGEFAVWIYNKEKTVFLMKEQEKTHINTTA